ncbi:MAG TPA: transcription termination/antitermination NusG family protein [Thermoanaerobaculia bacterium]|nr:transcription termination/antitermination NusG family protein [Thermoanaerobaculia bacterium]
MPNLRRESEIFPADLFSMPDGGPWTIVHVRSRQEKAVARLFMERKQPFYLPQIEKQVRRDGRTFKSFLPLFGGYVFVRLNDDTQQTLWRTKAVVRMIPVDDQELLDGELRQIRALQEAGAILVAHPEIAAGDVVRIADGVFQGYTGTVVRELDATRLVVSITALNKSVTAEFPRESVVPARAAKR